MGDWFQPQSHFVRPESFPLEKLKQQVILLRCLSLSLLYGVSFPPLSVHLGRSLALRRHRLVFSETEDETLSKQLDQEVIEGRDLRWRLWHTKITSIHDGVSVGCKASEEASITRSSEVGGEGLVDVGRGRGGEGGGGDVLWFDINIHTRSE